MASEITKPSQTKVRLSPAESIRSELSGSASAQVVLSCRLGSARRADYISNDSGRLHS